MNLHKLSFAAAVCAAAVTVAAPARVVRDIPYDPSIGAEGLGDLYLPEDVRPETPLILVIHGGGKRQLMQVHALILPNIRTDVIGNSALRI